MVRWFSESEHYLWMNDVFWDEMVTARSAMIRRENSKDTQWFQWQLEVNVGECKSNPLMNDLISQNAPQMI